MNKIIIILLLSILLATAGCTKITQKPSPYPIEEFTITLSTSSFSSGTQIKLDSANKTITKEHRNTWEEIKPTQEISEFQENDIEKIKKILKSTDVFLWEEAYSCADYDQDMCPQDYPSESLTITIGDNTKKISMYAPYQDSLPKELKELTAIIRELAR